MTNPSIVNHPSFGYLDFRRGATLHLIEINGRHVRSLKGPASMRILMHVTHLLHSWRAFGSRNTRENDFGRWIPTNDHKRPPWSTVNSSPSTEIRLYGIPRVVVGGSGGRLSNGREGSPTHEPHTRCIRALRCMTHFPPFFPLFPPSKKIWLQTASDGLTDGSTRTKQNTRQPQLGWAMCASPKLKCQCIHGQGRRGQSDGAGCIFS